MKRTARLNCYGTSVLRGTTFFLFLCFLGLWFYYRYFKPKKEIGKILEATDMTIEWANVELNAGTSQLHYWSGFASTYACMASYFALAQTGFPSSIAELQLPCKGPSELTHPAIRICKIEQTTRVTTGINCDEHEPDSKTCII